MKKACAVLLMLALLMTGVCANAAVHTISQLESDLTLPAGVTVFRDNSGDDIIDILYSLDGREDVAFETAVTYMEAYEGYTNGTLPQEALDALNSYYAGMIVGGMKGFEQVPFFAEEGREGSELNPFLLSGRDAGGNAVCLQLMVADGCVITVSAIASAEEFDGDTMEAYYSLFENFIAMIIDEDAETVRKSLSFSTAWRERVAALIRGALFSGTTASIGIFTSGQNAPASDTAGSAAPAATASDASGSGSTAGDNQGSTSASSSENGGPVMIYTTGGGNNNSSSNGGSGSIGSIAQYGENGGYSYGDDYCYDGNCSIPWFDDGYDYYYDDYGYDDWDYYYGYGYCYQGGDCW